MLHANEMLPSNQNYDLLCFDNSGNHLYRHTHTQGDVFQVIERGGTHRNSYISETIQVYLFPRVMIKLNFPCIKNPCKTPRRPLRILKLTGIISFQSCPYLTCFMLPLAYTVFIEWKRMIHFVKLRRYTIQITDR